MARRKTAYGAMHRPVKAHGLKMSRTAKKLAKYSSKHGRSK